MKTNDKDKELAERVSELERRVKELEAAPKEQHAHFHNYPPVYQQPYTPLTYQPNWIGTPLISPNRTYNFPLTTAGGNS